MRRTLVMMVMVVMMMMKIGLFLLMAAGICSAEHVMKGAAAAT